MNIPRPALVSVSFLLALCVGASGSCPVGELSCDDGQCITSRSWCDKNQDCLDKSDESYCQKKSYWGFKVDPNNCKKSHYLCLDGRCIPSDAKCNGHSDCQDGSDEEDCEGSQSKEDERSKEKDPWDDPWDPWPENYDPDVVSTTQATPDPQETSWKGEEEEETSSTVEKDYETSREEEVHEEQTTSFDPGSNYPSSRVTQEEEQAYNLPTATSAKAIAHHQTTTMGYYEKKATQSTHKTYAPEPHHVDALRYDTPTPETYVTRPTPTEHDSRRPPATHTQRTPYSYPQPTADPGRQPYSQRPPYTQYTPYPHRSPTQQPSHSYAQHLSPHSSSPQYSQRPPNSYPQPASYDHRQPGSYPQPTSYDHRQRASYPQPTSYDHRKQTSYPQPNSYDRQQPAYPNRDPHSHHPYTNPSSHPSYQRRQDPRRQEVQPWSDTRLAPSAYTGRRQAPSRLHFPKNYTQIHDRDNGGPMRRGKEWLIGLREPSGGWGANTSRALVALALVNNDFVEGSHENDLMKKYFKVHLGVKLLSPEEMGPNQVAGHVNALLATCQDPRDFHGTNIVRLLKDKLQGAHHGDPFVLLSLCLADEDLSTHQVYSLMRTLGGYLPRSERGKDLLSLSVSAFACHLQRYVASTHTDSNYTQSLRSALRNGTFSLLQLQLDDGSFGSVYSTALAAQALMSVNDSLNWDPNLTFRFLRDHQTRDGSFGDFLATYLALPALSGRSLLHLTSIRCHEEAPPEDLTPQEILMYRGPKQYIRYSLQFGNPLTNTYSVEVAVPHGINFFDVMRVADFQNKHFNFRYEKENTRIHVYSISDVPNDVERGLTWQLYIRRNSETGVPRRNEAYNGDIRELRATADQHYVFWYRPYNL